MINTILLVTVTKTETQAVLKAFSEATGQPWQRQIIGDKTYYALGSLGGAEIYLVRSEMGASTPGGALITIHKAMDDLHPAAIIMVGIAFGVNPQKQSMGDILVAKQLLAYEPQKISGRSKPIQRGDRVTCSIALLDKFRSADLDWTGAKVRFGLVLSGEKLVADVSFREQLLKMAPEAIGGEMEGAGLYTAASATHTDWILVKAICDWADDQKHDDFQPLAAKNAAEFVRHTITLGGWGEIPARPTAEAPNVGNHTPSGEIPMPATPQSSALDMARRSLAILEKQAAAFGSLHIPAHLQIELEDQRRKVQALEKNLMETLPEDTPQPKPANQMGNITINGPAVINQGDHASITQATPTPASSGPTFNIQGGVHAGHDVVMGAQTNYNFGELPAIRTRAEFVSELHDLQAKVAALRVIHKLDEDDVKLMEIIESRLENAAVEAQKPKPAAESITAALEKSKKTLDLLSGNVQAAVGLGGVLAGLIGLVSKLFGG